MRSKRLAAVLITGVALATVGGVVAFAATGAGSSSNRGWQMMGGRYVYSPAVSTPVRTLAAARSEAQRFASRLGLRVDEVLQFQRNFYAKLVDASGSAATEVLVDPSSGIVWLEYGPAMMWNTRYRMMNGAGARMMGSYGASMMGASRTGMMGAEGGRSTASGGHGAATMMGGSGSSGMMGGSGSGGPGGVGSAAPSAGAKVSLVSAHLLAQRWLDGNESGVKVESGGDAFPGYYTLETLNGPKITGMISVNSTTGAVWPHWWHGAFVAKSG